MKLHQIPTISGSTHRTKRLGCGRSSGHGKTCSRGMKGGKSRSGYGVRPGFEGGQTPLYRRFPHRGFNHGRFRKEFSIVNIGTLAGLEAIDTFDREAMLDLGLMHRRSAFIKVLGEGEITRKITVHADKISESAKAKIEAAGGTVVITE
ncbi:MAG TPA: 50S ribosomal protein L15 [Opitutales bacterium]|nr:50S ribosomal protein L15 [Opitutales bacterium]